jgi:hypothetical protein
MVFCIWLFGLFLLWGKYREFIDDELTRCRQSQCSDGLGLLIVVRL